MTRREGGPQEPEVAAPRGEGAAVVADPALEGKVRRLLEELRPVLEELADDPAE